MITKRCLLTGGTGFLGAMIYDALAGQDWEVVRMGRSESNEIKHDITTGVAELGRKFDLVVHAAGKAHSIPRSTREIREFFNVNVKGTSFLLQGLQKAGLLPDAIVFISSVSVYGLTRGKNITEDHPLSSRDPYGISKVKAENILLSWCEKNKVSLTILRLPLIAGSDPPGNLGAMVRGIKKGYYVNIGGGT